MKRIFTFLSALVMVFALATPALAAGISSSEQKVLDEFEEELNYWKKHAKLDDAHITQYKTQAENALTAVDLSQTACDEFSQAIKDVHKVFEGSTTRNDLWKHSAEAVAIVNNVGKKYYDLHVEVDPKTKNATVTWYVDNAKHTAGTGGSVIRQTGFDLSQTTIVVAAAAATLGVAFVIARKKQLFVD